MSTALVASPAARRTTSPIPGTKANDILAATAGADSLDGGPGDDTYFVDDVGDIVIEAAGEGFDRILASISYTLAAGSYIEMLTTTDNLATAPIDLTGNELPQYIYGNAGANVLDGAGGGDTLIGLGGDDQFFIRNAADRVLEEAGGGTDRVFAASSFTLNAGSHVEIMTTADNLATTAINLTGNELSQYIYGNAGANVLDGAGGGDTLIGFGGDDTYLIRSTGDRAVEQAGSGFDRVTSAVSFALETGSHVDMLTTIDNLASTSIDLIGNELSQYLFGNAGANSLDGMGGNDVLIGLGGADEFIFSTVPNGSTNVDRVVDFEVGIDRIVIGDTGDAFYMIGTGSGPLPSYAFVTGSQAQTLAHRIIYNPQTGALMYDADGANLVAAVQFALLAPGLALQASDIMVLTLRGAWDY